MAKNNDSGIGTFIAGMILGAIGGAAAALLMTPKRGDELRQELESRVSEKTGPMREKAAPLVTQGKDRASELVDKAADRAQDLSGKIAAMDLPFDDDRSDHEAGASDESAEAEPKSAAT